MTGGHVRITRKGQGRHAMSDRTEQLQHLNRRRFLLAGSVAVAVVGVGLWWRRRAPDYPGGKLSVAGAYAQAASGEVTLIDIRTPREWRATGIPDRGHPIDMRRGDFIAALTAITGPDRARPIALICARGVRSARMSLRLSEAGFTNILDVPEGMLGSGAGPGWLAQNLPVRPWQEGDG